MKIERRYLLETTVVVVVVAVAKDESFVLKGKESENEGDARKWPEGKRGGEKGNLIAGLLKLTELQVEKSSLLLISEKKEKGKKETLTPFRKPPHPFLPSL